MNALEEHMVIEISRLRGLLKELVALIKEIQVTRLSPGSPFYKHVDDILRRVEGEIH